MADKLQAFVIGDWSKDGHCKSDTFYFTSNKSTSELQAAYRDSIAKIGFSFGGFTEPGKAPKYRKVLGSYQEDTLDVDDIKRLQEFEGFDEVIRKYGGIVGSDEELLVSPKLMFHLMMWLIKLSLPDFEYEVSSPEFINGWWGDLNGMWGYGLYD